MLLLQVKEALLLLQCKSIATIVCFSTPQENGCILAVEGRIMGLASTDAFALSTMPRWSAYSCSDLITRLFTAQGLLDVFKIYLLITMSPASPLY